MVEDEPIIDEIIEEVEEEDQVAAAARRRLERKARKLAIMQKHKASKLAEPATAVGKIPGAEMETKKVTPAPSGVKSAPAIDEFDMFALDKFASTVKGSVRGKGDDGSQVPLEESSTLSDNWDDREGYYRERVHEKLHGGRYKVLAGRGKGVFSTVLFCKNTKRTPALPMEHVAVKIIRANDLMRKQSMKELAILREIGAADSKGTSYNVRVLEHFVHRNHLCLVFEAAEMNLREVLKKYGRDEGINIDAVRRYSKQLFTALRLLKKLGIVHADLKPDNILVSSDNQTIKVCDFGSAFKENSSEVVPTPYLVSRFYRAPEIILGDLYDCAIDVWAAATCIYEIFTGKVMFSGRDNNAMLYKMMLIKGTFSVKILKKHRANYEKLEKEHHFVQMPDWRFKLNKIDKVTKRIITSYIVVTQPKEDLGQHLVDAMGGDFKNRKLVMLLKDLLLKCLSLDPEKRLSASDALKHPFISSKVIQR